MATAGAFRNRTPRPAAPGQEPKRSGSRPPGRGAEHEPYILSTFGRGLLAQDGTLRRWNFRRALVQTQLNQPSAGADPFFRRFHRAFFALCLLLGPLCVSAWFGLCPEYGNPA